MVPSPIDRRHARRLAPAAALGPAVIAASCTILGACSPINVDPEQATRPYPRELRQDSVVRIQVIPGGTSIEIVNATARSYRDFDLWLNQRYMTHVDELLAGQSLTIPLNHFWDWRGEGPFEGGLFRYFAPTPIALVQAQVSPDAPLIGFIAVLPEGARDFYENPSALPQAPGQRRR